MRALSDALPTGHRAMANPTLQLRFGCGRATPPVSHSHNWPSGRMQNVLFKIGQKSYFLPIKTPKLILTIEWYYRSLYCRSNAMFFFSNGQFEGDIILCHLKWARAWLLSDKNPILLWNDQVDVPDWPTWAQPNTLRKLLAQCQLSTWICVAGRNVCVLCVWNFGSELRRNLNFFFASWLFR